MMMILDGSFLGIQEYIALDASTRVILLTSRAIYSCIPLKAIQYQGCHWSGKSQGILEFVMEIWNFVENQGNLRKFIFHKRLR